MIHTAWRTTIAVAMVAGTLPCVSAGAQGRGYEFRGDEIHVDRVDHWSQWRYQNDRVSQLYTRMDSVSIVAGRRAGAGLRLFDITPSGVKPRFFPGKTNYALDAGDFSYIDNVVYVNVEVTGNAAALSNTAGAAKAIDGDRSTYWQPADADFSADGLRNWQIDVNLGRTVWADSIVVVMPAVQEGGTIRVPRIPETASAYEDLSLELRAAVDAFSRRASLDSVVAEVDVITPSGDTLARAGDLVLAAGQQLPADIDRIRVLGALGLVDVAIRDTDDPGDVPKVFALQVSMGKQSGSVSSKSYRYDIVGRGQRAGGARRFVFPLQPLDKADFDQNGLPDVSGTFLHFVRLAIAGSDFDQLEYLGEGDEGLRALEALGAERRGRLVYRRITSGGFEKRIADLLDEAGNVEKTARQLYEELPEGERAPIQYFKRELPRIAEIEVWGRGPNVAYKPQTRAGGTYEDGGLGSTSLAFDGVYVSKWLGNSWDRRYSTGLGGGAQLVCCTMWVDLGATYWIDRIYIGNLTTSENSTEGALFGLWLNGSDGTTLRPMDMSNVQDFWQMESRLAWRDLVSEIHKDNNATRERITSEVFNLQKLRFFEFRNLDPTGRTSGQYSASGFFSEIHMYGEGYPAELTLLSNPIILIPGVAEEDASTVQATRVLSQIFWEAEAVVQRRDPLTGEMLEVSEPLSLHPEVDLQIQTRTSQTIDSLLTYYVVSGLGTASERRQEVDVGEFDATQHLWDQFNAYDVLPETETIRLRPHTTNRDDDGDGLVDEDPVDGSNNDGDRRIDEDGLTGQTGGPNSRGTVTITKHQRNQDDDGDGAQDEDEIDGLDNDGDFLIDEDGKRVSKPRTEPLLDVSPIFAGWSPWSPPYAPTGGEDRALITSPSPRKFLQVRVRIVSRDPLKSARIRSLRADLAPPISTEVVGELAVLTELGVGRPVRELPTLEDYLPPRDVAPLDHQPFAYFLRAAGPDPAVPEVAEGFDEVLIVASTPPEIMGVRVGQVSLVERTSPIDGSTLRRPVATRFVRSYMRADGDDLLRDEDGRPLTVTVGGDSLLLHFPESLNRGSDLLNNAIVEVQFRAQTLKAGTQIEAFVRHSGGQGIFQRVETEGRDATELVSSETVRPVVQYTGDPLGDVGVAKVFSPNGDLVNDELEIEFTILSLREDRPIRVDFYDLSGRRVASATPASGTGVGQSGRVRYTWGGYDRSGRLVPPGVYACRIELATDSGDHTAVRLVRVAY